MTDFKIEKNVPPPPSRGRHNYPWDKMQPGESFFVECEDPAERKRLSSRMSASASNFAMSMPLDDRKFTVRQVDDGDRVGVRAWRIE